LDLEEATIVYNLKNKQVTGSSGLPKYGLGKNPEVLSGHKGRGRISFFSKARNKALADVVVGKHLSIFVALRATKPREGFPS